MGDSACHVAMDQDYNPTSVAPAHEPRLDFHLSAPAFPHIHTSARHMEGGISREGLSACTEDQNGDESTLEVHVGQV